MARKGKPKVTVIDLDVVKFVSPDAHILLNCAGCGVAFRRRKIEGHPRAYQNFCRCGTVSRGVL